MRKIILYEKYKKKVIILSDQEVQEITSTPNYQVLYNNLLNKAERNLMSAIYFKQAFWMELLMIFFAALMSTIALDYFIISTGKTGLFPSGIGTIARFLAIITFPNSLKLQSNFYFIYYLILNIPLAFFSLYKIGLKFTCTTLIYIGFSLVWDQIINLIPFINPGEWHMIIDYNLISSIPEEWGVAIWLFIFAIAGGLVLGWSYALVYKIGTSTGGIDFISMYFSKKKNKNIGLINRQINFAVLALIIILNSTLMKVSEISPHFRYSVLHYANGTNLDYIYESGKNWWSEYGSTIIPKLDPDFDNLWQTNREYVLATLANSNSFVDYPKSLVISMKIKFIFGPSLFASILSIIIQSLVIDWVYPKYKFHTIMITTDEETKIKNFFFDSGYQNEIFEWSSNVESSRQQQKRKTLIVTVTVVNWRLLEQAILNLSPDINVNVLSTKKVYGRLNIQLKDGRIEKFVHTKLMNNQHLLQKIEDEALTKTVKKNLEIEHYKNNNFGNKGKGK